MKKKILAAALLGSISLGTQAEGFFIGGEIGSVVYPKWIDKINSSVIANGASFSSSEQETASIGAGVRGGQWLNDNFGWEVGYEDLGSIKGSTTAVFGGTTGTGNWKYSATALHAAALGGIKLGKSTLFGKVGMHNSSTKLDGTFVFGAGSYSHSASSTGLLLGGGYSFPFTEHLSGRAALDVFNGVKFTDWANFSNTTKENLVKVSFGLDYKF